jgi:hypothetical protein
LLHFPFISVIGLVLVRTFKVAVSNVVSEVHRQTKIKLYKALIKSIVWYGSEAFQRKVLRQICGTVLVNGQWRNRYNNEICKLYKEVEPTKNIRLRRLQLVGHVMRMKEERVPGRALQG